MPPCMRPAASLRSSSPASSLDQPSKWSKVKVQVLRLELEVLAELVHLLFKQHECLAEPLDLLGRQRPALDAPQRLAFHQLPNQLDESEHQLGESLLEALRIGVDAPPPSRAHPIELVAEELQLAASCQQPVLELTPAGLAARRRHREDSSGVKL